MFEFIILLSYHKHDMNTALFLIHLGTFIAHRYIGRRALELEEEEEERQ